MDLVGQQSGALVVFVPPISIEDHPMLWTLVRLQTYYPEHILAYGSGKTRYSLVKGSDSFWTDCYDGLLVGGLSTALRPGLQCWRLGVPVWMGTWTP
jgi:hypothetical protein